MRNKLLLNLSSLEAPFLREEIKLVVFELGADNTPGPDSFPILFFQKFWNIIDGDIFKLCSDFHSRSINLERINWASIALIPKSNSLESLADFRPISLINLVINKSCPNY